MRAHHVLDRELRRFGFEVPLRVLPELCAIAYGAMSMMLCVSNASENAYPDGCARDQPS